jgi:putative NADPH-quinone reductase
MKIYVLDGGPRKGWNTNLMCESFAEGARSAGADVELIRLYDLSYRGCYSCFACKLRGGKSYGKCAYPDEIHDLLERVSLSDGAAFGSPVYMGDITAQLRGFAERLMYPFHSFDAKRQGIAPKRLETAVIYTMNVREPVLKERYIGPNGDGPLGFFERFLESTFSKPERVCAFDTLHFEDYGKYVADFFDSEAKAESRRTQFPKDLRNAFDAGVRMAERIRRKG